MDPKETKPNHPSSGPVAHAGAPKHGKKAHDEPDALEQAQKRRAELEKEIEELEKARDKAAEELKKAQDQSVPVKAAELRRIEDQRAARAAEAQFLAFAEPAEEGAARAAALQGASGDQIRAVLAKKQQEHLDDHSEAELKAELARRQLTQPRNVV